MPFWIVLIHKDFIINSVNIINFINFIYYINYIMIKPKYETLLSSDLQYQLPFAVETF